MELFDDKTIEELVLCFGKDENVNTKSRDLITKIFTDKRLEMPIGRIITKMISTSLLTLDGDSYSDDIEIFNTIYNMQMYYLFKNSNVIDVVREMVSELKVKTKVHIDFSDSNSDEDLATIQILSGILYFIEKFTDMKYLNHKFNSGKVLINILDDLDPQLLKGLEGIVTLALSENSKFSTHINNALVTHICGNILSDLRLKSVGNINMPDDLSDIKDVINTLLEPTTILLL